MIHQILRNWLNRQQKLQLELQLERERERDAYLAALNGMLKVCVAASDASRAQSEALTQFLKGFEVTDRPKDRPFDEQADYNRYLERNGFPTDGSPLAEAEWILENMDKQ